MEAVEKGVRRITFALPLGIDHVHCYLLRASTGGWILVDTGLGTRDPEAQWRPVLDELDAPIRRVAAKDAPIPYNRMLEASMLPNVERIVTAVHDVLYR